MDDLTATDSTPDEVRAVLAAARDAASGLAEWSLRDRARLLRGMAEALEKAAYELVSVAIEESALPEPRLRGELARSTGQLRMFADVVEEGSFLEVVIDTADPEAVPVPRPDLRRMLVPLGPVLVFAASNFPFAFSVPGGDTASALAAGASVIVKGHPGHPRLSMLTCRVLAAAAREHGAPDGTIGLVLGERAGVETLEAAEVAAAAFTGSVRGGRALHDIAMRREVPIPFYGELGSLNPVIVTEGAARERAAQIAEGYVASFTLGVGQFCTKPGLVLAQAAADLADHLRGAVQQVTAGAMLTPQIRARFFSGLQALRDVPGVRVLAEGAGVAEGVVPTVLQLDVPTLLRHPDVLLEECFGPATLLVTYTDQAELEQAVAILPASLAATVHGSDPQDPATQALVRSLQARCGRVVWNGWPTGVAVTWAMHHGGPYPATIGSVHTSVGATALRRFQRPICYQDVPPALLPSALKDENVLGIPRRIDGRITDGPVPISG